jgi:hypothetical protein
MREQIYPAQNIQGEKGYSQRDSLRASSLFRLQGPAILDGAAPSQCHAVKYWMKGIT